jgi:hypothetical protein
VRAPVVVVVGCDGLEMVGGLGMVVMAVWWWLMVVMVVVGLGLT